MRIALLNPTYWPEVRRGTERLVHDLALALTRAGHDVSVLTSHRARRSVSREDGFRVVRSYRPPRRLVHRRGWEPHLANVPAAAKGLLRGRYDLAHAFAVPDAWAAVQARPLGGPPVVFSIHGVPSGRSLGAYRPRQTMLGHILAEAATVSVLSEAAAEPFRHHLRREPVILPGAIFGADFEARSPRAPRPTLICAASLDDPRKRGELLLRAFAALRARCADARLLLAGGGDPFATAARDAPEALPPGVERIAVDETPALASAYSSAWASVLPSVEEAFGLVLVESLAAGTPCVAARSGASPEVLGEGAPALLFEPDDEEALVLALEEALELGRRSDVAEACRASARVWDWSAVLPLYEAVYEEALEGVAAFRPRRGAARGL